jgi:hypothetical protein
MESSCGNSILENEISNCETGIWITGRAPSDQVDNLIFHNNFINDVHPHVGPDEWYVWGMGTMYIGPQPNSWDDGLEGNYWDTFVGVDCNEDGVYETNYTIENANVDNRPLAGPFSRFNTPSGYDINVISNSRIDWFRFSKSNSTIEMHISNMTANQTQGFCRICIPHALISEPYSVAIDGSDPAYSNFTLYDNGTHRWIYFTYQQSANDVVVHGSKTPPIISIMSPENKAYAVSDLPLIFTVDEETSWMAYSLDWQANVTISGNVTLSGLGEKWYDLVVYANDTVGNMGVSRTVHTAVDTSPPEILDVSQSPPKDNVLPEEEVKVNATVVDYISEVKQVTLDYTIGNGTWIKVEMKNLGGNNWSGSIHAFPRNTWVNYTITAIDDAGNTITSIEVAGYQLQYQVIPEFEILPVLPLLTVIVLLTGMVSRRNRRR